METQYQRIIVADSQLSTWIERNNVTDIGVLDEELLFDKVQSYHQPALISVINKGSWLLRQYGKTFERDVTPEVQRIIDLHQGTFDAYYEDMQRERSMNRMYKALANQNLLLWRECFETAAVDMKTQFLQIREARKHLFDFDQQGTDYGCDIDIHVSLDNRPFDFGNGH